MTTMSKPYKVYHWIGTNFDEIKNAFILFPAPGSYKVPSALFVLDETGEAVTNVSLYDYLVKYEKGAKVLNENELLDFFKEE